MANRENLNQAGVVFTYPNGDEIIMEAETYCAECGKIMTDMESNYGTEDIWICIHCYQLAQGK